MSAHIAKIRDYEASLGRLVPGVRKVMHEGYHEFWLACHRGCGEALVFRTRTLLPADVVASKIANMGWKLGSKSTCPGPHNKEPHPMAANDPAPTNVSAMLRETGIVPAAPKLPSRDARAMRREAMDWLTEAFDPDKGRYKAGIHDASIAAETGLAEEAVAKLREEFFGPIKLPSEVEELLSKMQAIREMIGDFDTYYKTEMEKLKTDARKLENRLSSMVAKNGWEE